MASRFVNVLTLAVVVALSASLWTTRRHEAELRAELAYGTESFVSGAPIPPIELRSANGAARLDTLCDGRTPMLVYFHRGDCPACGRLDGSWKELGEGSRVALHQIHLDGLPVTTEAGAAHWSASAGQVLRQARIRSVPAVIRVGRDCRVAAAGAGPYSTRLLFQRAAREAPR